MVRYVNLIQKSDIPVQTEEITRQGVSFHRGGEAQYPATQMGCVTDWLEDR
jgi:hypothetical protein